MKKTHRIVSRSVLRGLLAAAALAAPIAAAQLPLDTLRQNAQREPGSLDAQLDLGNAYLEAGMLDEAQATFLDAISIDYRSGDAHFGLGLTEYERGDLPAALFQFNEVTRLYPERFDGHFNRAVTLAKLERYDESVEAFREAVANAEDASVSEQVSAYLGLAGQLTKLEDHAGAADAYGAALELRPSDNELTYLHGQALYRAGMGIDALPELSDLEARSKDYRVTSLIANIYIQAEQTDYAIASLQRALRQAQLARDTGAQANLLIGLGQLQRDLGNNDAAISAFQRAAAADASSYEARYNLGVSYLEGGQPQSAIGYLENATNLNPESGEAHLALATAYGQVGRTDEAFQTAQGALNRLEDPELAAQANFVVGSGFYKRGDFERALETFEAVLQEQPDNAQAQLWAGLSEYQQENYDEAAQYIERAVQLDPESVEARVNLGAAYLASNRFQDAELVYQLVVEEAPEDAEAHYNLGWSLYSQNRREDAKEAWVRASSLGYTPAQEALQTYF